MVSELILFLAFLSALYIILELIKPEPQVGIVKGNVTYGDASLVEGVTMTLVKDGTIAASALTKADGTFEFDPVAIGTYELAAHKDVPEGYLTAAQFLDVTGDGVMVTDLPLVKLYV